MATSCYGGLASARYARSLLALRPACAARSVGLHVELGGGEALSGRGRAAMMAAFLASRASHLLFVAAGVGFAPQAVFRLLDSGHEVVGGVIGGQPGSDDDDIEPLPHAADATPEGFRQVAGLGAGFLLIARAAAQRMTDAHPQLRARLGDFKDARSPAAAMVFDSVVDPATRRYLTDGWAFCHRWRALGGEVWADVAGPLAPVDAVIHSSAGPI